MEKKQKRHIQKSTGSDVKQLNKIEQVSGSPVSIRTREKRG